MTASTQVAQHSNNEEADVKLQPFFSICRLVPLQVVASFRLVSKERNSNGTDSLFSSFCGGFLNNTKSPARGENNQNFDRWRPPPFIH